MGVVVAVVAFVVLRDGVHGPNVSEFGSLWPVLQELKVQKVENVRVLRQQLA